MPAIPVLSPRPAYTDQRIGQIRTLAREKIFRWLAPPRQENISICLAPLSFYNEFVELTFDKTVEIGEPLLIPLGGGRNSEVTSEGESVHAFDDEAPLFIGYSRLAQALQKGNCESDPIGAELREDEFLKAGEVSLALEYHLCTLSLEPGSLDHWRRLWTQYGEYIQREDTTPHRVRALCEGYREAGQPPVAAAKSCLWLADFTYHNDQRVRLGLLFVLRFQQPRG